MSNEGDDTISFDGNGICNYCSYALGRKNEVYFPNDKGKEKLNEMLLHLKDKGKNKQYDCLMGVSGGLDSSYLLYLGAVEWGLKILAVHIEDGFDTEIAKQNIMSLCKICNVDLINIQIDKEQFFDLTAAYVKSGVPAICNPQDNILFANLFHIAKKHKINYLLSGTNFALESILQRGNTHFYADKVQIKDIHKKFGTKKIDNLRLIGLFDRYLWSKYVKRIKYLRPLDFIEYNKNKAFEKLKALGYEYYGGKHHESILTRFTQCYYLPKKFNVDKRRSHLSSLIIDNQITRDEALEELKKPLYEENLLHEDIEYVLKCLNITQSEFEGIMSSPPKKHSDYKVSWMTKFADIARKHRNKLSD